jgi:hypothetical protein
MIFAAFGLLAVAVALLIAAIIKSSVTFGIAALFATVGAGVFILLANAYYRRLTVAKPDELRRLATDPTAARNADGATGVQPAAAGAPGAAAPAYAGNGSGMVAVMAPPGVGVSGPPVEGFDALNATHATTVVDTLGIDDLHGLRRWEVEHAGRKTVLAAIDKRIQSIVEVRKQISSFEG